MDRIRSLRYVIIAMLILLLSCRNCRKSRNGPGDATDVGAAGVVPVADSNLIDSGHRSMISCTPDSDYDSLSVTLRGQEADFWCWAASAEMVMEYLGAPIDQCHEANENCDPSMGDCCGSTTCEFCDDGGWPQFEKYGFLADTTHLRALSWEDVRTQIGCQKTPFCMTWITSAAGGDTDGHMMVVGGYKTEGGSNYVLKLDPSPEHKGSMQWITYAEYVNGPHNLHWDDYFNVRTPTHVH